MPPYPPASAGVFRGVRGRRRRFPRRRVRGRARGGREETGQGGTKRGFRHRPSPLTRRARSVWHNMFVPELSVAEKVIRPIVVYLCLVVMVRLAGRRELAQLNSFDLVVLMMLANTVQ